MSKKGRGNPDKQKNGSSEIKLTPKGKKQPQEMV